MYAIIDIETTGGKYNEEGITEIAIYLYDGMEVRDRFVSLINPEKPIQPFVEQLTGIKTEMLRNAPKFYEVAKRIIEITKDATLVAHNASFDYRILFNQFKQLGYNFDVPTLCTVELTKQLMPELESYSLGKLCRNMGIPVSDRHRASGDAEATLKLFKILLQKDQSKTIVKASIKKGNKRDLSKKLLGILENVPKTVGVFYVFNFKKEVIYIGKGQSLYQSVNELFLQTNPKARKIRKEMTSLSFEETGSLLIKKIKYTEGLICHRPKFNSALVKPARIRKYSNPNMILIDRGRSPMEKSVVLIENESFTGYGFFDLNYQLENHEILKSLITQHKIPQPIDPVIKEHLKIGKIEKIIRF